MVLILRTSLQRKKSQQHVVLYTVMSLHWYFKFWAFTFWTCRPKLSVEWHWLQIFLSQIFLYFGQFYLYSKQACSKMLANWTAITDTYTFNGFARNAKHGCDSW